MIFHDYVHEVSVDMCQHENNYTGIGELHGLRVFQTVDTLNC